MFSYLNLLPIVLPQIEIVVGILVQLRRELLFEAPIAVMRPARKRNENRNEKKFTIKRTRLFFYLLWRTKEEKDSPHLSAFSFSFSNSNEPQKNYIAINVCKRILQSLGKSLLRFWKYIKYYLALCTFLIFALVISSVRRFKIKLKRW